MKVLCYSRKPMEDEIYAEKLAYSMHLALIHKEKDLIALNHNSGILYAKATQNADGTLSAKNLKNPWIFSMENGTYGVIAQRIHSDGSDDESAKGKLLLFTSDDLIHYKEQLVDLEREEFIEDATCRYVAEKECYQLLWKEKSGKCFSIETQDLTEDLSKKNIQNITEDEFGKQIRDNLEEVKQEKLPEGAIVRNILTISDEVAKRLKIRFVTPENVANEVPEQITLSSIEELENVKAIARYSDGSSVMKKVDWYTEQIDWTTPGKYVVIGRIHQDRFEFPMAWHKADPCIGKWKGKYYFISTNDLDREHTIYIREANSIPGLVTAQQVKILDAYTYPHLGNLLWAPELHVIEDRLYVFHAGTPQEFLEEQCHIMALKENGNPMVASDWEMPVRVLRKDGTYLYDKAGITLDMTQFEVAGKYYVCWSQRQFNPVDQGAWLYIAQIDPKEPWKLITDPVLLSMPEYGWANNHTFVDEGPFALIRDNKIYLTFSSAAVDSTYVVGLMSADLDADLLNPESWLKENSPLLSSRSAENQFGPGHNAYVTDDEGMVWNTYHARPGVDGPRSSGIRRVHFNVEGFPVLDMTEELDLNPELAFVQMEVIVEKKK